MTIEICTCNNQLQPHDRMPDVCPPAPVYGMPAAQWNAYGNECANECDDCFRTDGTHDPEVEH